MKFGETTVTLLADADVETALDIAVDLYSWVSLGFEDRPTAVLVRKRLDRGDLVLYDIVHDGARVAIGALHPTDGAPWVDVLAPAGSLDIDVGVNAGVCLCHAFFARYPEKSVLFFYTDPDTAEFIEPLEALGFVRGEVDEDRAYEGIVQLVLTRDAYRRGMAKFKAKGFVIVD